MKPLIMIYNQYGTETPTLFQETEKLSHYFLQYC